MIPYGRQEITQSDIDSVVEVLRSEFLTQGPVVPQFEQSVAKRVGANFAVAVNSATSALHIACLALGLEAGNTLWTVPNTFVASANCGRYCGARVDFVDIDPVTWNMNVSALEEKLLQAKRSRRLPTVVVPVHFGGQPTEQEAIWALAQEYGFKIIEDASHAIGAARNGHEVGSCRWSDITVFSFHPVKIVTCAEGGMALTNDRAVAERMLLLRSHGITRDAAQFRSPEEAARGALDGRDPPSWYYEQHLLGFNYRMTDLQAALGLSQLARLDQYVDRRNELARRYAAALKGLPLKLPTIRPENRSAFHLYVVRLMPGVVEKPHREVFDGLRGMGVGANLHYFPVHLQPYYRELGFSPGQFPEAEAHGREALSLPLYPRMTDEMQDGVVEAVRRALEF